MRTHIVTPSKLTVKEDQRDPKPDPERLAYATTSVASLRHSLKGMFPHIVVDDSAIKCYAKAIYDGCILLDGYDSGMVKATILGIEEAERRGSELVFLHLDDMYYVDGADRLCRFAEEAMLERPSLQVIHLSNYPLIEGRCTMERGNHTFLDIGESHISFDNVRLSPIRKSDYTIWASELHPQMVQGEYWPLALWFSFYRTTFISKLFKYLIAARPSVCTLGQAETFFREQETWNFVVSNHPGEIGYVNMQFGGFEMHRNKNCLDTIRIPNNETR